MMKFESDLPTSNVRVIPAGTPDSADLWLEEQELDEAWGEWLELTFDPDCDPPF